MPRIWVSLGSNIDREANIRAAVSELSRLLGDGIVSPVYETDAEGFEGPAFYNLVTGYETDRPPAELIALFRELEERLGRKRSNARFDSRTIDIDLLTWGDMVAEVSSKQLPRDDIADYAFREKFTQRQFDAQQNQTESEDQESCGLMYQPSQAP